MRRFHEDLRRESEEKGFRYNYVTAWEMAQLVHQAERGANAPDFVPLR